MSIYDLPTLVVTIDFGNGLESVRFRRFSWNRGRARERDRLSPARARVVLPNENGDFDNDNPASPHFPNVRPNRRIQAVAKVDSGIGPWRMGASPLGARDAFGGGTLEIELFTGRTEGGPQRYGDASGAGGYVEWAAVDDSKRLNRDRSTSGYGSGNQLTGARVTAVLDGTMPVWPSAERDIDPGRRTVQAATGDLGRYDYLLQVAESEGGGFFIGADGKAVFRDADYNPAPDPVPFGDVDGEHRYLDISIDDDDKEIFNFITVSASGQTDQTAEDIGSEAEFGRADLPLSTLLSNTVDMAELADGVLSAYSQPRKRIGHLLLGTRRTNWRKVLSKELLERIEGRHRTPYAVLLDQILAVQGIAGDVLDKFTWRIGWDLSPPVPTAANTNLLTANQSSIETDATGWTAESGCTIARSTAESFVGSASLAITTTGALLVQGKTRTTPSTTAPVTVGQDYLATAWVKAGGDFFAFVEISWRDGGGVELSVTSGTLRVINAFDGWTSITVQGTAPASAVYGVVRLVVQEPYNNANIHYADAISLRHVED